MDTTTTTTLSLYYYYSTETNPLTPLDFVKTRNLSTLKVFNMIGNKKLSTFIPFNPILEGGWAFLTLLSPAPFLSNRF